MILLPIAATLSVHIVETLRHIIASHVNFIFECGHFINVWLLRLFVANLTIKILLMHGFLGSHVH